MTIRSLIGEIAAEWPKYKERGKVDKTAQAYSLVVNHFPSELQSLAQNADSLKFHGSTGQGNVTAAPWIAAFDTRITSSATSGYYVVYLFSIDLQRLILEFGFGTTQFTNHFNKKSECYERIRIAAKAMQDRHEKKLLPALKQALLDSISREPVDLAATPKDGLHEAYEQSSIYSVEYSLSNLPPEIKLTEDFNSFLRLYREVVSDPFESNMEDLFEWVAEPTKTTNESSVSTFEPRPEKKKRKTVSSRSPKRRRSKESLKVGNAGEKAVFKHEKEKLIKAGLTSLADKVVHEAAEGNTPGWDITSFDKDGEKIYIEVKSSTGKIITSVDITDNEWKAASDNRDKYFLYLVTNALATTSPPIEILRNPWHYVDKGDLEIRPIVHELSLRRKGKG
jgi:hypothetical protein